MLAEDVGFEPTEPIKVRQFSKLLLSATQPILQYAPGHLLYFQYSPCIHFVQIVALATCNGPEAFAFGPAVAESMGFEHYMFRTRFG